MWICPGCLKEQANVCDGTCEACRSLETCPLQSWCDHCQKLLRNEWRPNFQPDQPVVIEYTNDLKRKMPQQQQSSMQEKKVAHQKKVVEEKTLFDLAMEPWPDIRPSKLAKMHPQELDDTVYLDETNDKHLYYVKYDEEMESQNNMSATTMIHQYFSEFNSLEALEAALKGQKWGPNHDRYGKYFTTNKNELIQNLLKIWHMWEGAKLGKFVHFLIECDLNDDLDLATDQRYCNYRHIQQFNQWKRDIFLPVYEKYRTEFRFRSCKKYRRVGTADFLAVRKDHPPPEETDGVLYVVDFDWKNTVLKKSGYNGKKGFGLCAQSADCNLEHYSLQQADYGRFAKQTIYGKWPYKGHIYTKMVFEKRVLVCFDETNRDNKAIEEVLDPKFDPQTGEKLKNKHDALVAAMWERRRKEVEEWEANGRPPIVKKKHEHIPDDKRIELLKAMVERVQKTKIIYDEPRAAA